MLDAIRTLLFGSGKVKFKVLFADGRKATVKVKYTGDINALTQEDLDQIKKKIEFEHGKVAHMELVDILENK